MLNRFNNPKIQPDHLERQAFIYVRQSTLVQVRDNTGSKARQYDLVQRALNLGWPRERITVIDHIVPMSFGRIRVIRVPPWWAGMGFSAWFRKLAWATPEQSSVWKFPAWRARAVTGIA